MPTHQDETLPQRYAREHQDHLKLCGSMTAEQVADLQLQLNNSMAREQALQALLTAADEELGQCQSMALMIEEKEWAELVGTGPISSRVESAFTQMHNELSEARQGLTAADERADVLTSALEGMLEYFPEGHSDGECFSVDKAKAALKPAEGSKPSTCTWSEGGFSWHTGCGKEWQFTDGGLPAENGMHFCHSCGKTLVVEQVEGGGDE